MGKPIMLDEKLPYGKVLGDDHVFFKQGGYDFDSRKHLIPGSRNSASALISDEIEELSEKKVYVYEDMHIHALKRHLEAMYEALEANDIDFEKVVMGKGAQERIIEFLNKYS